MDKKYKVVVDGEMEFSFTKEQLDSLDIQSTSKNSVHILKENRSFKASLEQKDFLKKSYSVKINSHTKKKSRHENRSAENKIFND